MTNNRANSVAVVHHCENLLGSMIRDRARFQRRVRRVIEDMVENGFTNFILPIDKHSPFAASFLDAIIEERGHNTNINLTIMLPNEIDVDGCFSKSSAERLRHYTRYADEIIYSKKEYDITILSAHNVELTEVASALILYFDGDSSLLDEVIDYSQKYQLPFVNINL